MRSRRLSVCLAAVLASTLGGCATKMNLDADRQIFGGTWLDLNTAPCLLWGSIAPGPGPEFIGREGAAVLGVAAIFDLPLSILGDTLTLPYTTWATLTGHTRPADSIEAANRKREAQERRSKGGQETGDQQADGMPPAP